jgi:type I restriction enzyme, S subunit
LNRRDGHRLAILATDWKSASDTKNALKRITGQQTTGFSPFHIPAYEFHSYAPIHKTMNELLLDYFDDIIGRAADVPRLNEAILQLAVRGKLVAQDPADEPAAELLRRIAAEKKRLGIKSKKLPEIGEEERQYSLPSGWEWVKYGELGITQTGKTPPTKDPENFGNDYSFIKPADISEGGVDFSGEGLSQSGVENGRLIEANSALMVCIGGSIGKVGYVDRDCSCNQQINTITPYLDMDGRFFAYFMRSPYFQSQVLTNASQTTLPILSKGKWNQIPFPLPPLAEQKRIVARVDELLTQTRALEKRLAQAEANLTTLHETAVFHFLHSDNSDDLAAYWQFIADNFDLLYDERYPAAALANVAQLKQAILQLAVRGKLTRQDPNDEPAAALLRRIAAEKKRLGIKSKKLPEIGEEERPFVLPDGWAWVRFGQLGITQTGKTPPTKEPENFGNDFSFIKPADISEDGVD